MTELLNKEYLIRVKQEVNKRIKRGKSVKFRQPVKKKKRKKIKKKRIERNRIPKKYPIYIKSKYWTIRKNRYFKAHGKKCAICGSSKFVQLHHLYYGNYGFEEDKDLKPLCRVHHEMFHEEHKTKKDLRIETKDFISSEKILFPLKAEMEHQDNFIKSI